MPVFKKSKENMWCKSEEPNCIVQLIQRLIPAIAQVIFEESQKTWVQILFPLPIVQGFEVSWTHRACRFDHHHVLPSFFCQWRHENIPLDGKVNAALPTGIFHWISRQSLFQTQKQMSISIALNRYCNSTDKIYSPIWFSSKCPTAIK